MVRTRSGNAPCSVSGRVGIPSELSKVAQYRSTRAQRVKIPARDEAAPYASTACSDRNSRSGRAARERECAVCTFSRLQLINTCHQFCFRTTDFAVGLVHGFFFEL